MGRLIDADEVNEAIYKSFEDVQFYDGTGYDIYSDSKEIIDKIPTVEAIPKAEYETRLKNDMTAMLEDLKKEMKPIKEAEYQIYGIEHWNFVGTCQDIVQQRIDKLRKESIDELQMVKNNTNNWIKCSDRLPDLNVDVLGTAKDDGDVVKVTRLRTCLEKCGWDWILTDDVSGTAYKSDEIIAWMPLPEGFKEESNGNEKV